MILLLGIKTDPVLRYFFGRGYVQKDKRVLFINVDRIGEDIMITNKGWVLPSGEFLPHSEITGVYNRMLSQPSSGFHYYLQWLLDECYPNVVNRPKDTLVNFSKIWQLEKARDAGFDIPKTAILANNRVDKQKGYIYKSISSRRSIVKSVVTNSQKNVYEPVVFQSDKGRYNIRAHVLGEEVVSQEIFSQEVDYRYDLNASFARRCKLPVFLEQKIKAFTKDLKLVFSGIDFIVLNNQYFFLEINPSPGYAYFEKQLYGSPISAMLYKFLRKNE